MAVSVLAQGSVAWSAVSMVSLAVDRCRDSVDTSSQVFRYIRSGSGRVSSKTIGNLISSLTDTLVYYCSLRLLCVPCRIYSHSVLFMFYPRFIVFRCRLSLRRKW